MCMNREPRFYHGVTYNNSVWQGGRMNAPAAITIYRSGPNGRDGHPTDFSKSGYLVRKNVGPGTNIGSGGNGQRKERPVALFRLGEVYNSYAEALNDYTPGNPAIPFFLTLILYRAGFPQLDPPS